jgi:hypothetical protein
VEDYCSGFNCLRLSLRAGFVKAGMNLRSPEKQVIFGPSPRSRKSKSQLEGLVALTT